MPSTPPPDRSPSDESQEGSDPEETTWAGNRPLDTRWWWSPALMVVVGAAVIGYQSGPLRSGDGIFLNWVMVAIGAAVAVAGLVSLRRAHAQHTAETGRDDAEQERKG